VALDIPRCLLRRRQDWLLAADSSLTSGTTAKEATTCRATVSEAREQQSAKLRRTELRSVVQQSVELRRKELLPVEQQSAELRQTELRSVVQQSAELRRTELRPVEQQPAELRRPEPNQRRRLINHAPSVSEDWSTRGSQHCLPAAVYAGRCTYVGKD